MSNTVLDQLGIDDSLKIVQYLASKSPDYVPVSANLKGVTFPAIPQATQDELARDLLNVLAEDPLQAKSIQKLSQGNQTTQKFDVGFGSAAFMVAVVVFLRTHLKYEKKSETMTFKIEHKPIDSKALKVFLDKLTKYLP